MLTLDEKINAIKMLETTVSMLCQLLAKEIEKNKLLESELMKFQENIQAYQDGILALEQREDL